MSDEAKADADAGANANANAQANAQANADAQANANANADADHHAMPEGAEPPPRGHHFMAVVRWALVVLMAVIAFSALRYGLHRSDGTHAPSSEIWYCPMHPSVVSDRPGECPICGMALVKREGASTSPSSSSHAGHRHVPSDPYACPMHPEETGLSPDDRCPLCSMKLEPRPHGDAGVASGTHVPGLAPIELTFDRIQLIGMKTSKATKESLTPELKTVGYVTATEQGIAKVTTKFPGYVEALAVSETGRKVRRGQVLASVYSPQVYLAEQEYLTAKSFGSLGPHASGSDVTQSMATDARKRLELLGVSEAEIAAIDKSGKPSRWIAVVAPRDGIILQKNAIVGLAFQPGSELYTIADLSRVWVVADVYEGELSRVKNGQLATLTLVAYPDRKFPGEVKFVYPTIDPATRTAKVRLELKNPQAVANDESTRELRPGMYGDVAISLPKSEGVVIPREALVDSGDVQYVFVDLGQGKFEPRRVTVGVRSGEKVEIRTGVADGETVVTTGNFLLDSESRLRAAIEGTPAAPAPPASSTAHGGH